MSVGPGRLPESVHVLLGATLLRATVEHAHTVWFSWEPRTAPAASLELHDVCFALVLDTLRTGAFASLPSHNVLLIATDDCRKKHSTTTHNAIQCLRPSAAIGQNPSKTLLAVKTKAGPGRKPSSRPCQLHATTGSTPVGRTGVTCVLTQVG